MPPAPEPSFVTDIEFPIHPNNLGGKTITLLGGAKVEDLRFNSDDGVTGLIDDEYIRFQGDPFNHVITSENVITFGDYSGGGPMIASVYLENQKVIVANNGAMAPFYVSDLGNNLFDVNAELPASEDISTINVHGLTGRIGETDWPPLSNIEDISFVDGYLQVIGSDAWLPAPFNLQFEVQLDEKTYEFHITLV